MRWLRQVKILCECLVLRAACALGIRQHESVFYRMRNLVSAERGQYASGPGRCPGVDPGEPEQVEPASFRQPQDGFLRLGGNDQTEDPLRCEQAGGEQQQFFVGEAAGMAGGGPERIRVGKGGVVERRVGDYQVEAGYRSSGCSGYGGAAAEFL